MGKKSKKKGTRTKVSASPVTEKSVLSTPQIPESPELPSQPTPQPVRESAIDLRNVPVPLQHAFPFLTPKQQVLSRLLCSPLLGQIHLFESWPVDSELESKVNFVRQLETLNDNCPCGLASYIASARKLVCCDNDRCEALELDMKELVRVGFVLVEDDDSNKENVADVETWFLAVLNAVKAHTFDKMTLCVVSSSQECVDSLETSNYFGMGKDQVSLLRRTGRVPVISRGDVKLITKDGFTILDEVPDSHNLFFASKIAKDWAASGIKWVSFCNQGFDGISEDCLRVTALRLDTRATVDLCFMQAKFEPPTFDILESDADSANGFMDESTITSETAPVVVSSQEKVVYVPSWTEPATSEADGKKEECACSCAIS